MKSRNTAGENRIKRRLQMERKILIQYFGI